MPSEPQHMMKISELQVNQEYENLLPLLLDEDVKNLEKSILKDGVLHPFIVNQDKVVLDGHHRLLICKRQAITEVPFIERSFDSDLEEKEFVISFNLNRRHLTTTQKVELALTIRKIEMEKAGRRQKATQLAGRSRDNEPIFKSSVGQNSDAPNKEVGRADEIAAKKVGLSRDTLRKGKQILDATEKDPEAYAAWDRLAQGDGSIHSVHKELFDKQIQEEEAPTQLPTKLDGVFQVIVIDLPAFNTEKLKTIDVPFDKTNCVLWLWTPFKSICDAVSLLHHWQFKVQTMLTWVKNKRGSGNWLLNQTEYCILATRGNPIANSTSQSTALIATPGEHHSKPDEFYSIVESLSDGRKLIISSSSMIEHPGWGKISMGN